MRRTYSTITPAVVHTLTRSILATTLQFQPHKRSVTLPQLLDLILLIAASARTLHAIATRYLPFSHETARLALHANFTTPEILTQRLADALHAVAAFRRVDRQRLWTVAIDLHYVPYYGDRSAERVVGGQRSRAPSSSTAMPPLC